MSRRIVATAYGPPGALALVEEPTREPGPGKVRIAVRAAGVNQADVKMYSGAWGTDPDKLPIALGFEIAGVVDAVGVDVEGVAVGDEVIAQPVTGGYADEAVAKADALVAKPAGLGWVEAAGLLLTGTAAFHAVTAAGVEEGDTVLIHGGAGGVGLMAIQLAVLRGARVIATDGEAAFDLLRELGAEPTLYGDGLVDRVRALGGVDAVVDAVGSDDVLAASLELVADRDRIATLANFTTAFDAGIKVLGSGGDPGDELRRAAQPELARLAGDGRLRVVIASTFGLEQAADAHRYLTGRHGPGKVVLEP